MDPIGMAWQAYIKLSYDEQSKVLADLDKKEIRGLYGFFWYIQDSIENGELIREAMHVIDLAYFERKNREQS